MIVHEKKEKKAKFRISFIILFILASFIACFVFYMKEDFVIPNDIPASSDFNDNYSDLEQGDNLGESQGENLSAENKVVNPVPISNTVDFSFLNSSFFVGGDLIKYSDLEILPKKNVFSDETFTIKNVNGDSFELYNKISDGEYENVYFFANTNDVTEDFSSYFDELDKFLADFENSSVNFYLVSVLPTGSSSENSIINKFNSELLNYANLNGISYLDINIEFVGADGKISGDLVESDGSLTEDSLKKIRDYILCHVKNEMV